jgi:hypothetical protein
MALKKWIGRAAATPQIQRVTLGSPASGVAYTITINERTVRYVCASGDTATVAAENLVTALGQSDFAEFQEITWSSVAAVVFGTGPSDGKPFTVSVSVSGGGGGGTISTATDVTPTGPNWWTNAANWVGGLPADGDDVVVDDGPSILYGISQGALSLNMLSVEGEFRGEIGLPSYSGSGTSYPEYRTQRLTLGASGVTLDADIRRGRFDFGTDAAEIVVLRGDGIDILATNSANTLRLGLGTVSIASLDGETSQFATITMSGGSLLIGSGVTLATLEQAGGEVTLNATVTTVVKTGGSLTRSAGAVTTFRNRGGDVTDRSAGTITTLHNGSTWIRSGPIPCTYTNTILYRESSLMDVNGLVTFTNPVQFFECHPPGNGGAVGSAPAYFNPGLHKKFAVTGI